MSNNSRGSRRSNSRSSSRGSRRSSSRSNSRSSSRSNSRGSRRGRRNSSISSSRGSRRSSSRGSSRSGSRGSRRSSSRGSSRSGSRKDEHALEVFYRVCNYSQLIEANVMFLEGKLSRTPYQWGAIDEETLPLVKDLIRINRLGFLTVQGQPAEDSTEFVEKVQKWVSTKQRPYLEGYLPAFLLPDFIDFMETQPGYMYNVYELSLTPSMLRWISPQDVSCTLIESNAPPRFNVTMDKGAPSRRELMDAPWREYTNIPQENAYSFEDFENILPILIPHTVNVFVFGTTYGEGSTERLMLQFLTKYPYAVKSVDRSIDITREHNVVPQRSRCVLL